MKAAYMSHRSLALLLIVLFVGLSAGCRPKEKPAPPKNLLEWFQQKQRNMETPDGPIDMSSVKTTDEETVQYDTVKGSVRKTWKMRYRPDGKGGYEPIGEPVEVTPTQ
jgi:hypothetical protein